MQRSVTWSLKTLLAFVALAGIGAAVLRLVEPVIRPRWIVADLKANELTAVEISGPNGRIISNDAETLIAIRSAIINATATPRGTTGGRGYFTLRLHFAGNRCRLKMWCRGRHWGLCIPGAPSTEPGWATHEALLPEPAPPELAKILASMYDFPGGE